MSRSDESQRGRSRKRRRAWPTFVVVVAVLVCLRAAMPVAVRGWVDAKLDAIPEYEAEIGDIDMNLWRGAYEVEDVRLFKEGRPRKAGAFFEAARVDLSVNWGALLRGAVVGTIDVHRPALRFVAGEGEREEQTGIDVSWHERVAALFPFRVDRFAVLDGRVNFEQTVGEEVVDLYLDDLYLEVRNLSNIRDTERSLPAEAEAACRPLGTGELELALVFDPVAEEPLLELDAAARGVPLVELNGYLRTFGTFDAEDGELSIYAELASADGRFEGYVKTLLEDVEILAFRDVRDDPAGALTALWEAFAAVGAEVLENQPRDRIATRAPLEGSVADMGTDLWEIVGGLLRNAFVEALRPVLDDSIELGDLPTARAATRARESGGAGS